MDKEQGFAPKASSKVTGDGKIVSSALEDMAPFLEREELEGIRFPKKTEGESCDEKSIAYRRF